MEAFIEAHADQFQFLNIPEDFYESLYAQFQAIDTGSNQAMLGIPSGELGSIIVLAHICSWDMLLESNRGLFDGLAALSCELLGKVYDSLCTISNQDPGDAVADYDNYSLIEAISCHPLLWACVILYRDVNGRVRGALPAPPFFPPLAVNSPTDDTEANLSGPFGFRYLAENGDIIDYSLVYVDPLYNSKEFTLPNLDYVPLYTVPDARTRSIRYAALLGLQAPCFAIDTVKEIYATFVHQMHLVRQQKLEMKLLCQELRLDPPLIPQNRVYKVYTDTNDPMKLSHPDAGLSKDLFKLVDNIKDADIVYSYQSLFAPGKIHDEIASRADVLINQFPYEGAFVQKDHLGRELLRQHGLPRPQWALESYDLDCQLGEFIGAAWMDYERFRSWPLWIVKPASGTQSKGHIVTKSLAQVLRLVDTGSFSRVAQRYLEEPVCYHGRKIDCRCIVIMTPGSIYMHKRVYFRIAAKPHSIQRWSDLVDHEIVLSAMHLVDENDPNAEHPERMILPIDSVTIAELEKNYGDAGFNWNTTVLPKVHKLIKELFLGMKQSYPAMVASSKSRALYGVDVMFEVGADGIEPKLTEVTFCPSNNAVCDAYQRDDDLFLNYNTDIFKCMFLGQVSESIIQLQ